ncbi:centrosome-associated protein CEP250 [Trichomycterus rosablanca]|uniref:centrosome-associated protein CEP250 n=1 Tax=Trichomycterus rosablanca TaxID=2290929 RepID=UPI002F35094B
MDSELLIGWEAERVELRAELSRLEEELAESRAETDEFRSRTNALTERLSQTLNTSVPVGWEVEQREWRRKLREGKEREARQALLIHKLQQKVMDYRSRCETLQQRAMTEEKEIMIRERLLRDERSDNLETSLIRLEEEQQRNVTLVEVNSLLRSQLSQSGEANQALQEDLKKLTSDWSRAVEEADQKEMDWNKEKEVLTGYLSAEHSRLMSLWSGTVALKRQCHAVKTATDKDLWEIRAEFSRLSSTFLSLNVPPVPPTSTLSAPAPPLSSTVGPMTIDELDHDIYTKKLTDRIDELTVMIKSQEFERQKHEEELDRRNREEEREHEKLQEKHRAMERDMESVTHALMKLQRVLSSQRLEGHTRSRVFSAPGAFTDDLHALLTIIAQAETAIQWKHQELQEAEGHWHRSRAEAELLQQQIRELESERVDLQKQADQELLELKRIQSLLSSEKEMVLSLKKQLDESEQRGEDLKKENSRLIQLREKEEEQRNELERERQRRVEAELVESAQLCERESRSRLEVHSLRGALEQERLEKARAEKEAADTREALIKARESLLSLSSTHTLLKREAADTRDSLEKMTALNESLIRDKRECNAQIIKLEEEAAESEVQLQRLRADLASLHRELNTVSEENAELRACRVVDLDSLHQLKDGEREMERELHMLSEERESLTAAFTDEKQRNQQLSDLYSSVCEELHTVRTKLDKAVEQKQKEVRMMQELQREKQRLEIVVLTTEQEREEVIQDRDEIRNLSVALQQQLCLSKEQISVLEVQHTQVQMQVHALQQAKDVIQGEIKCLQSELERTSNLLEDEKSRASEERLLYKRDVESFQLEIKRLKTEAEQMSERHKMQDDEKRETWQRERESLNQELGLKDGEIRALRNRMDGLAKENEELSILMGEKIADVESLSSKVRSLESQIRESKDEFEKCKEHLKDVQNEKDRLLEQVTQEQEDLNNNEREKSELVDLLRVRDKEIKNSHKHIQELTEKVKLQDGLLEKLRQELRNKEIEADAQVEEVERSANMRVIEEREKERKLQEELTKKEIELDGLRCNLEELVKEKNHMVYLLQEKDNNLENLKRIDAEMKDQVEWWKKKTEDVEIEKEVLTERVDSLVSVKQERDSLAELLREVKEEINQLKERDQNRVQNQERLKEQLRELETEVEDCRNTIEKLTQEKIEQEQKCKMHLEQMEEREQKMKVEISELHGVNMDLKRKVLQQEEHLQTQIIIFKEKKTELNRLKETFEQQDRDVKEELRRLKQELKDAETDHETEKALREDSDHRLQLARTKADQEEEKVKELEELNKRSTKDAEVLREKLDSRSKELEAEVRMLNLREEDMEDEKRQLKQSLEEGTWKREQLQNELKKHVEEINHLKEKDQERVQDKKQIGERVRGLEGEVEDCRSTIESTVKEKNELEQKWKMLQEQLEEREQKMKVEISELAELNTQIKRKVLVQEEQLQTQTILLKEKEMEVQRLNETLEQNDKETKENVRRIKEMLKAEIHEKERTLQNDCDQRLQLAMARVDQEEGKVKELEDENKKLTDELRGRLEEQSRELERKSKLYQETSEKVQLLKLRLENMEEEQQQLKMSLQERKQQKDRLEMELKNSREDEAKSRSELKQQIQGLQNYLKRKEGEIILLNERIDGIVKQNEQELKELKENNEELETEVAKLKEEVMVLSISKEKTKTLVKERDEENKKIKEGLKAGLEEMVCLKELLEESHREGEILRKILEEKKNEMVKGRREEIQAAWKEANELHLRVQILQVENEELKTQLQIQLQKEQTAMQKNREIEEKLELNVQNLKKLEEDLEVKNKKRINKELREKEQDINTIERTIDKDKSSFRLLQEEHVEKNHENDGVNAVMKFVESVKEIRFATEEHHKKESDKVDKAKKLLEERLDEANNKTQVLKRQTDINKPEDLEKVNRLLNIQNHEMRAYQRQTLTDEMDTSQASVLLWKDTSRRLTEKEVEVYGLREEVVELGKDRDRFKSALEKNEEMLIHYKEKLQQLENHKVKEVESNHVEIWDTDTPLQRRVVTLQRAVAELELQIKKLQQRNERLEQRIDKLREQKKNLKDTLKQVELEREKLRRQHSPSSLDAGLQDFSGPAGADELTRLRAQASELTEQVHHLRLMLAADHQERADFIDRSMRNSESLQTLRQDLNDSLELVSRQLVPPVLKSETQRLDRSIREEQLRLSVSQN